MPAPSLKAKAGPGRSRDKDIDRYVGAKMRERRMMLGLNQQQVVELVGVSYQQAYKYEKGLNRVAAGRLFTIADVLGVDVGFFFEGFDGEGSFKPTAQQRAFLDLARDFARLASRKHQEAICSLARALANPELALSDDSDDLPPRDAA